MTNNSLELVKDLPLRSSMIRKLWYGNILYVSDLVSNTEEDLLSIYGIGKKSLNGIKAALVRHGLSLMDRRFWSK